MTYPQQPAYGQPYGAPQQQPYPPQQPQQPYGQPAAPQFQPQQQPYQPTGGAALPVAPPPLATGGATTGGTWPKMRHLQGCTVIFEPIRVDETAVIKTGVDKGKSAPEAYFNLIVVDAPNGMIQYGDSQDADKPRPLTWERTVPCRFTNCNDNGFGPVNEVRNALAAGEPARVGVVERGTQGGRPYMITKPDKVIGGGDRPDGQERFMRASQVWAQVFGQLHGDPNASFTNPEPRSLLAPPAAQPQQVAYGQPPQQQPPAQTYGQAYAQQTAPGFQTPYAAANPGTGPYGDGRPQPQQYAPAMQGVQQGYVPTPYGQAPAGAVHPEYAAAVQQPGAMIAAPPPGQQGYPAGYGQYAPQPPAQPAANPAFEAYIASLPPEQQAGARAQYAASQPQQQPAQQGGPGI